MSISAVSRIALWVVLTPVILCAAVMLAPLIILWGIARLIDQWFLLNRLRSQWPAGKFVLIAYTDSPLWAPYLEANLLRHIGDSTVVVNKSRESWKREYPAERKAIDFWGGRKANNPIAIVCVGWFRARTFRFYQEFQDFKHGHPAELERRVKEVIECVRNIAQEGR